MSESDAQPQSSLNEMPEEEVIQKADSVALRQRLLVLMFLGDIFAAYLGMTMGFWLRFHTPLLDVGASVSGTITFRSYQPILLLGVIFLIAAFFQQKLYNWKYLLRPRKLLPMTFKAIVFWFVIYLCTSVVLKFEPQISRIFMACSFVSVTLTVGIWKWFFTRSVRTTGVAKTLSQKVMFVGWNQESAELADSIYGDESHPYSVLGWVDTSTADVNTQTAPAIYGRLGDLGELERVIDSESPDILIIADLNLDRKSIARIAKVCEVHYVQLKVLPSMFQIFVSGLRLETISSKPLLGIEEMAIQQISGLFLKRSLDVLGALFGLIVSSPVFLVCYLLIKKEDPGPVIFSQERIGRNHLPFKIYKIRSMKLGSDKQDHMNQSTLREDPRVLKIGKFIRAWNIDELPQFWNVLKGDMSLVGPRPERTHFVNRLSSEIDYYNNRHIVKPGITGWAQIHGLRGDTDLSERIRYDVYYIENWSLWLDIYCLVMTFLARKNAY